MVVIKMMGVGGCRQDDDGCGGRYHVFHGGVCGGGDIQTIGFGGVHNLWWK